MPQVNARRFEKNKKSDDHVKDVDFFREFNKVKNTVFATNNWVKALERFRETKGYSGKIENVENVEELDKQMSEYIATMKQQNGTDYSVSSIRAAVAALYRYLNKNSIVKHVNLYDSNIFTSLSETVNGKIKYLTDLGHGEANGSDGLTAEEIKQVLSHRLMDGSTPERLLRRVFFHNATILGLRGGEHSFIMADDFKKRKDGGFDVYIYRSKTNQRGLNNRGKADILIIPNHKEIIHDYESYFARRPVLSDPEFYLQEANEELALQTGIWYKKNHIGQTRLKKFMLDICKMTGINTTNRKISNHTGRKTMIRGLQSAGLSLDKMRLQSRHHSDEGLKPYMSSREPEKLDMMNKLVEQFHDVESKAISNTNTRQSETNEGEKGQENCGFMKASEVLKVSAVSNHTPFQPVNNTSMEISMKPEQFMSLLQNGALANLNIKINLAN